VLANVVQGSDGRWGACDSRGLWAHRRAASAVYDAAVRAELSTRLGVGWTARHGAPTEVDGVSPLLRGEFSSRGADVRRQVTEWGSRSTRGTRAAWAATRPEKQRREGFDVLAAQWAGRASAVCVEGPGPFPIQMGGRSEHVVDEHRFGASLSHAADGAARRRDVVEAFGVAAVDGATPDALVKLTDMWWPSPPATEVGVAERGRPLAAVVPGPHLLRELGPRPCDPAAHEIWREAARGIEAYRRRWQISTEREGFPLTGTAPRRVDQLIDRLETERQVREARVRLGFRAPQLLEMDRGR
jgi:hypothetical protein